MASGKADDRVDWSRRIGLRACDPRHGRERSSARRQMQERAARKFSGGPPAGQYYSNFSARERSRGYWPRWPNLNFEPTLEQTDALHDHGHCRSGAAKCLTILAILSGPILVATIVMIVVFEIRDAWHRNRLW